MLRAFTRSAALVVVLSTAIVGTNGCSGSSLSKFLPLPTPAPAPVVNVAPSSLTLSLSNTKTGTITASETGGSGFFTAQTSDATKATVAPAPSSNNVFTVTALALGSCNIIVSDGRGGSTSVKVTVGS